MGALPWRSARKHSEQRRGCLGGAAGGGGGGGGGGVVVVVVAAAANDARALQGVAISQSASSVAAPDHHHDVLRAAPAASCGCPPSPCAADSLASPCPPLLGPRRESQGWSPRPLPKASRLPSSAPGGQHLLLFLFLFLVLAFQLRHVLHER